MDECTVADDGALRILERVEGGKHQVSTCTGAPCVLGWATGNLPEPPNNPQVGMANMRAVMPALQKATAAAVAVDAKTFAQVELPKQTRQTRIVKDAPADEVAREIAEWIKG